MKPEYELYNQIDNYLNNKLSEAESQEFAQKLLVDTELAQQVKLQSLTNELIIENRFNEIFANAATTYDKEKSNLRNKLLTAGAAILVASGALLYFYGGNKTETPSQNISSDSLAVTSVVEPRINQDIVLSPNELVAKNSVIVSNPDKKQEIETNNAVTNTTENVIAAKESQVTSTEILSREEVKHEQVVDKGTKAAIINLCENIVITAHVYQTPACEDENNGSIAIATTTIKGGKAPYAFSIDGGMHFQKSANFSNLAAGNYNVTIKDGNDCDNALAKSYSLSFKKCFKEFNFSFNPQMGENWKYQLETPSNFSVKVINKSEQTVWKNTYAAAQEIIWDGNTLNNETLSSGIYLYEIIFDNGTNQRGTITILK